MHQNSEIITLLKDAIGVSKVLIGAALEERYHHIWAMEEALHAKAMVLPETTSEVSKICKICNEHNQSIIIFGGLTNLVGATETEGNEVIISMERMNEIEELDQVCRTITVGSGVILETIQNKAKEKELLFPLNFGARGTAQIGGIISTNAGGLRVFRFGMTRNLVLGLEVVLMDGTIISSLKKIIKDNSAYDLKHLFIGSEGTLGIITKAVLKLTIAPTSRNSAFLAFKNYNNVLDFLTKANKKLGHILSGFEIMWPDVFEIQTGPDTPWKAPISKGYPFYVLLETLGSDHKSDKEKVMHLLEHALTEETIIDGAIADNQSDLDLFWGIREDVEIMNSSSPYSQHFDISLPTSEIGNYGENFRQEILAISGVEHCFVFGHIADGNIHLIAGKTSNDQTLTDQINAIVYAPLTSLGGSVSAEHGIGLHKKSFLSICKTPEEINLMKQIKRTLDPKNLLNPGKVIDI